MNFKKKSTLNGRIWIWQKMFVFFLFFFFVFFLSQMVIMVRWDVLSHLLYLIRPWKVNKMKPRAGASNSIHSFSFFQQCMTKTIFGFRSQVCLFQRLYCQDFILICVCLYILPQCFCEILSSSLHYSLFIDLFLCWCVVGFRGNGVT